MKNSVLFVVEITDYFENIRFWNRKQETDWCDEARLRK